MSKKMKPLPTVDVLGSNKVFAKLFGVNKTGDATTHLRKREAYGEPTLCGLTFKSEFNRYADSSPHKVFSVCPGCAAKAGVKADKIVKHEAVSAAAIGLKPAVLSKRGRKAAQAGTLKVAPPKVQHSNGSAQKIKLVEGMTSVTHGERRLLLEHLKAMGGTATFDALSAKMGKPVAPFSKSIKPLLSGLSKGGWIKYT